MFRAFSLFVSQIRRVLRANLSNDPAGYAQGQQPPTDMSYNQAMLYVEDTNKISDIYWIYTYPQNVMISASLFVHLW